MDQRLKSLCIQLPDYWKDISGDNPDGPPTFINEIISDPGILQISIAEFLSGKVPNPGLAALIDLSQNIGLKNGFGDLKSKLSENCKYGIFGCVQFSNSQFPYTSIWHISDGKNFIFATFICSENPDQNQIGDVRNILTSIKRKSWLSRLLASLRAY